MSDQSKSLGEKRIRTSFNPSDNSVVQHIKERGAETINYINEHVFGEAGNEKTPEILRLKEIALNKIEEGIMFAVKAATV